MPQTLKLAYCAKCKPAVPLAIATDFKALPKHPAPDGKSMHEATVVDMEVDLESAMKVGESPAKYLTRMTEKYVPKKV